MKEYVGTKVKAEEWGVTIGTVSKWCREGLIHGVEQDAKGSPWRIPSDAVCPKTTAKQKSLKI